MDSSFDYVHWEKSFLPIFADDWIHDKPPQELITVPEEFDFDTTVQLNLKKTKKSEKTEWKPNPMEI
ncbi:hypothetical protein BDF21DRAFT_421824 [Thamnidium elegans]|uniref:Uncharacterized protein n=1 Tax=Thamnidium elegans TaxID=101142 RepID=A0A8H7VX77_9FUNG|nr:hypothetical protein INT48_004808 [Thamnidium elegans]KAI8077005.1 hypothetical protein BDF21DRAFT_421824 [Thamnidium elegans]